MSEQNIQLSSPWVLFYREVEALFAQDPDVKVKLEDDSYTLRIFVESDLKADAIRKLLPRSKQFGNVTLNIEVVPADAEETYFILLRRAFEGNGALADIINGKIIDHDVSYFMFKKEVVQYYGDNGADPNGLISTLYADIAEDVIGSDAENYFSTTNEDSK